MAAPKLKLLVDLDGTLIHTTRAPKKKFQQLPEDMFHLQSYDITKIRPHTFQFLDRMVKHYEMTVVTLAMRSYAVQVVAKLDPEKKYFGGRIISRDELGNSGTKTVKLSTLFPECLSQTAILDDRVDVWDGRSNVVQIKAYKYFKDRKEDLTLMHMERVLLDAHKRFHEHFRKTGEMLNMSDVIGKMRTDFCRGMTVMVVGFRNSDKMKYTEILNKLGATVVEKVTSETSCVVASWRTLVVWDAARYGVPVTSKGWIKYVDEMWEKPNFDQFLSWPNVWNTLMRCLIPNCVSMSKSR